MQWYYEGSNGQVGPINEEEFQSLIKDGTINHSTLVWNSTMTDWKEYGDLNAVSDGQGTSDRSVCAECGRSFPRDDMIKYGESWVCAQCKPVFVQKIKEGVNITQMDYAGFWIRLGAYLIDAVIMGVISMILSFSLGIFMALQGTSQQNPAAGAVGSLVIVFLSLLIPIAYETFFIGKWSATIGKMACGVIVVTADGDNITYLRAFARYFAKQVSGLILAIGYIMAAFDDEKRGLHDRMCSTRVVRK